ncbi:MAG TPA: ABC transporter substrate-binding protein, partial [Candidatus Binatia bacterium]|nr:ABC transporter substrate-binding protein [Candidatus Binatia bacterium]
MLKFFAALLIILVVPCPVNATDKIRIAIPNSAVQFITMPLAQKMGFLKEEELEAEIIQMQSGTAVMTGLVSREIDYMTPIALGVQPAITGLPIRIVACYVPATFLVLMAQPRFKSVKELRGTTIAVSNFVSVPFFLARMIAKRFGLDTDRSLKFLASGTPDARLAALSQGLVSAAMLPVPWDSRAMKMGFISLAKAHELFTYPDVGLVASLNKIKERPEEIKRVIKAGIKANRYIRTHRDGTIQFMREWLKIDKGIAAATYDSLAQFFNEDGNLPEDGLRLLIEDVKKLAKANREVSFGEVADL